MRQAARRMVGIGGATAVAIGAALGLALPASAHVPVLNAKCVNGQVEIQISLTQYQTKTGSDNTVSVVDENGNNVLSTLGVPTPNNPVAFGNQFIVTRPNNPNAPFVTFTTSQENPAVGHTFTMVVTAEDDPNDANHKNGTKNGEKNGVWDGTFTASTKSCVDTTTTTQPPTTTTVPPTTTTAPPTTTKPPTVPPTTTTARPTTTTTPAVAAATTTPGSGGGSLPFTGVNAALPLGIAGVLVLAGGAILAWLRFGPRRRKA